jgi:alpha-beta hydrolase superfamily lysophospholipase
MRYVAALLLLFVITPWAQGADYAREKRWAEEITPGLVVGEPVYLKAQGHSFLTLYAKAENAKGAVVLVHGLGVHPDWGLIGTLRSQLPDAGYSTLSVQMPVLGNDAKPEAYMATFPEAVMRLKEAVSYLQSQGYKRIAVVSHSMGSRMTDRYFAQNPTSPVSAWVAIGMSVPYTSTDKLKIPMLDLYGEQDLPPVLQTAAKRGQEVKKLKGGEQIRAPGTDHFFDGHDEELQRYVRGFLDKVWQASR